MNMVLIGAVIFVVIAIIYKFFFSNNNGVVYAEIYELNGGNLVRLNPKASSKCQIKKEQNTQKLFIPKRFTNNQKQGIEIPSSSDYIMNYNGLRLIKLIKINENEFKLAKPSLNVDEKEYTLKYKPIERDVAFWADNETMRVNSDYKTEDGLLKKLAPFIALGLVAIVCLMMISMTLDKAGEMTSDAKEERSAMTKLIGNLIDNPGSVANAINNKDSEGIPTNVTKPPGST
jgi:hypothetical protein